MTEEIPYGIRGSYHGKSAEKYPDEVLNVWKIKLGSSIQNKLSFESIFLRTFRGVPGTNYRWMPE